MKFIFYLLKRFDYYFALYFQYSQHVNGVSNLTPTCLPWPTGHMHIQERPPLMAAKWWNAAIIRELKASQRPTPDLPSLSVALCASISYLKYLLHSAAVHSQFAMELQEWGTNRPSLHPSNWTHIRSVIIFEFTLHCLVLTEAAFI